MPTIRIAVASTPLTATLDEAVPAAIAAVEEAGRLGAQVLCLPETALPGHRLQSRRVPDVAQGELDSAVDAVAAAAASARRHDRRCRAPDAGRPRDRRCR